MPTPDPMAVYRKIAPEVGPAVYLLGWIWPVQTCASYGRAEPQDFKQVFLLMSRN